MATKYGGIIEEKDYKYGGIIEPDIYKNWSKSTDVNFEKKKLNNAKNSLKSYLEKNNVTTDNGIFSTPNPFTIQTKALQDRLTGETHLTQKNKNDFVNLPIADKNNMEEFKKISSTNEAKQLTKEVKIARNEKSMIQSIADIKKAKEDYAKKTGFQKTISEITAPIRGVADIFFRNDNIVEDDNGAVYSLPNYAESMNNEIHKGAGWLGGIVNDVGYQAGKLAASSALNGIAPGLGSAAYSSDMFLNSYNSVLREGYTQQQASAYAIVSTATEYLTQRILGASVGRFKGDSPFEEWVGDKLKKVITSETMNKMLSTMASEGTEEFAQEFLDQINRNMILGENEQIITGERILQAAYSGLIGALSSGATEGSGIIMRNNIQSSVEQIIYDIERESNTNLSDEEKAHIYNTVVEQSRNNNGIIDNNAVIEDFNSIETKQQLADDIESSINQLEEMRKETESNREQKKIDKQINEFKEQLENIQKQINGLNTENTLNRRNIINDKVNRYIENVKNDFNSNVDIDTSIVSSSDVSPVNYENAKQVTIYKKAKDLFAKIGKKTFNVNNEDIYVNNADIKESIDKTITNAEQKKYIKENIAVFSKLNEIIENATELSSSELDNKGRPQYSNYKYYVSNAVIDGKPYVVEFDTRMENKNGKDERHFRLERVYPLEKEVPATGASKKLPNRFVTETSSYLDNTTNNQNSQIAPLPTNSNMQNNSKNAANANKSNNTLMIKAEKIANDINESGAFNSEERRWINTSTESEQIKGKVTKEQLDPNKITYKIKSNKKTLEQANLKLKNMGYAKSVEYVKSLLNSDKLPSATDIALAERTIQEAIKNKDFETAQDLIMDTAIIGTDLGQAVQALSIIQRLTPEGQLKLYSKIVQRAKARGETSFQNVEITPEMVKTILEAYNADGSYNQDDLNARVEKFKQDIADQLQTSTAEKINAWRYLAMLGNPKTHIRNVISNVAMRYTIKAKNAVARTLETVLPIENRTKTWKKSSETVKKYAKDTAESIKDIITGEAKYNEKTAIESKKEIFKNKTLEKISNFNGDALEAEDWFFSKRAFIDTFQEYLTANGIVTEQDILNNPEIVEKGTDYAVEQANIATFRQYSQLASQINQFEKKSKIGKLAIEATVPFKKTPINVAKAGINYSPLGLIKNISYDAYQLKQGNINASQFIDNLSQGMTGTALTLIGYALAKAGILKGSGDDDKESKYDSQLGSQDYAIKIGDNYYSISWLSPVAMPLLVGANAFEQLEEGKEWNMNVVTESLAKTLDPLNEMSFMQSVTNALSSYSSGTQKLAGMGESVAQSYIGQFFPTLLSQIASTFDNKKRSTKAANNSSYKFGEQTVRSIMYKIPGLRQQLETATDIWGNEKEQNPNIIERAFESFIAPYSKTKDISTQLDEEIKKVYNETGNTSVIPSIPYAYIKYGDETYRMSAQEYTQYKKTYGQTAYSLLSEVTSDAMYSNLTYDEKSKVLEDILGYSKFLANKEYFDDINIDYTNNKYAKAYLYDKVGNINNYYLFKTQEFTSDKDSNGKTITNSRKNKVIGYLNNSNLSNIERKIILKMEYSSVTDYDADIINYVKANVSDLALRKEILEYIGYTIRNGRVYTK